jgi:outer membrane protein assembly factor BamE (lipoprotein component of BamABCDE complex)
MYPFTLAKAIAAASLAGAALISGCAGGLLANAGPPRSDEVFGRIAPGMTNDDVRRLVGPPDETMRFPMSNTLSWDYYYQDTWGYMAIFYVTFGADGRVVTKISRRINDGGDFSGR